MLQEGIKRQPQTNTEAWAATASVAHTAPPLGAPHLLLAQDGMPGRTLFLRHGSAPASRSSATVLALPLRTAAWRAEVPF